MGNSYISRFVKSLKDTGKILPKNKPSRNPLLSLLHPRKWTDITIFNWYESIPDYKYGLLQSLAAIVYVALLKISRRKIVWVLHNKKSHADGHGSLKLFMAKYIAYMSDLIITHAQEGVEIIRKSYPSASGKVHYLDHPTINRLSSTLNENPVYDFLIWGNITPYKGVAEFVSYLKMRHDFKPWVYIAGNCSDSHLRRQIIQTSDNNIKLDLENISFDKLQKLIANSRFVLIPYKSETVLSSGILMDSLSFGAKVIGPNTGSFRDYAKNPLLRVYCYDSFDDLQDFLLRHGDEAIVSSEYKYFLEDNDWQHFATRLLKLLGI